MSLKTPGSRPENDRTVSLTRRIESLIAVILAVGGVVLFLLGLRGADRVRQQFDLSEIDSLGRALQSVLDDEPGLVDRLLLSAAADSTQIHWPPSNSAMLTATVPLKTRVENLQRRSPQDQDAQSLDPSTRAGIATLANAEHRFPDALRIIPEADEQPTAMAGADAAASLLFRLLQVRADAFFGMKQWDNALSGYRRMLELRPTSLIAPARMAECLHRLGRDAEARDLRGRLAANYNNEGTEFFAQGKFVVALEQYDKAVRLQRSLGTNEASLSLKEEMAIVLVNRGNALLASKGAESAVTNYDTAIALQTVLYEQAPRIELSEALALSHQLRADARLAEGKSELAVPDYEKAITLRTALLRSRSNIVAGDLGYVHINLGNAFFARQNLEGALSNYERAIAVLSGVEGRARAITLATALNNRGVGRRVQGRVEPALIDFSEAVRLLAPHAGTGTYSNPEAKLNPLPGGTGHNGVRPTWFKLDVALGYTDRSLEWVTRTRFIERDETPDARIALATSLKNRGYAQLAQRRTAEALEDFVRGAELYRTLVEQEGKGDLAPQFARALLPAAWIYATASESSLRNGRRAREYAHKACEFTFWKYPIAVEAWAAACAEAGDYKLAVESQRRAIELSPNERRTELRARLKEYEAGRPYREPGSPGR